MHMLTSLPEDDTLMTEFESIFVVNPDDTKQTEKKPSINLKPKLVVYCYMINA